MNMDMQPTIVPAQPGFYLLHMPQLDGIESTDLKGVEQELDDYFAHRDSIIAWRILDEERDESFVAFPVTPSCWTDRDTAYAVLQPNGQVYSSGDEWFTSYADFRHDMARSVLHSIALRRAKRKTRLAK